MNAAARREEVSHLLKGIERYNPENLVRLEVYVDEQSSLNEYDLEANLAILKLYQFNPHCFRPEMVVKILLKALTHMPHTDFILCKSLLDLQSMPERDVQDILRVMEFHTLLETCQFKEFWVRIQVLMRL